MRDLKLAEMAVEYALRFIGKRYYWGEGIGKGDDPVFGFDCSGYISEVLRATGVFNNAQRENAAGILTIFKKKVAPGPDIGVLAFYGSKPNAPTHVAIFRDERFILESGGGNSSTINDTTAAIRNAFVRMRPYTYRSDLIALADPFMGE